MCPTIKGEESKNQNQESVFLDKKKALIIQSGLFILEETSGFEPLALRFCKPFPWTTRARLQNVFWGTLSLDDQGPVVNNK